MLSILLPLSLLLLLAPIIYYSATNSNSGLFGDDKNDEDQLSFDDDNDDDDDDYDDEQYRWSIPEVKVSTTSIPYRFDQTTEPLPPPTTTTTTTSTTVAPSPILKKMATIKFFEKLSTELIQSVPGSVKPEYRLKLSPPNAKPADKFEPILPRSELRFVPLGPALKNDSTLEKFEYKLVKNKTETETQRAKLPKYTKQMLSELAVQIRNISNLFRKLPPEVHDRLIEYLDSEDLETTTDTTIATTIPTATKTETPLAKNGKQEEESFTPDFSDFLKTFAKTSDDLPYDSFIDEMLDQQQDEEYVSDLESPIEVDFTGIPVRYIGDPLNKSNFLGIVERTEFVFDARDFHENNASFARLFEHKQTLEQLRARVVLLNGLQYGRQENSMLDCRCKVSTNENSLFDSGRLKVNCGKRLVLIIGGQGDLVGEAPYTRLTDALIKFSDRSDQIGTVALFEWQVLENRLVKSQSKLEQLRLLGRLVAYFVERLRMTCSVNPKMVHVIGQSAGGHVAGFAGKYARQTYNWTFGRITGLDVTGPKFDEVPQDRRLAKGDADFVDAIHANLDDNHDPKRSGFIQPYADLDFYPNRGGPQPHCPHYLADCNYYAGLNFLAYSIMASNLCQFDAYPCKDFVTGEPRNRHNIDTVMGYYADHRDDQEIKSGQTSAARGVRCLVTSVRFPFCYGSHKQRAKMAAFFPFKMA